MKIRMWVNVRIEQMFSLPKSPIDRTIMEWKSFEINLMPQVIRKSLDTALRKAAELQAEIREGDQFQL